MGLLQIGCCNVCSKKCLQPDQATKPTDSSHVTGSCLGCAVYSADTLPRLQRQMLLASHVWPTIHAIGLTEFLAVGSRQKLGFGVCLGRQIDSPCCAAGSRESSCSWRVLSVTDVRDG